METTCFPRWLEDRLDDLAHAYADALGCHSIAGWYTTMASLPKGAARASDLDWLGESLLLAGPSLPAPPVERLECVLAAARQLKASHVLRDWMVALCAAHISRHGWQNTPQTKFLGSQRGRHLFFLYWTRVSLLIRNHNGGVGHQAINRSIAALAWLYREEGLDGLSHRLNIIQAISVADVAENSPTEPAPSTLHDGTAQDRAEEQVRRALLPGNIRRYVPGLGNNHLANALDIAWQNAHVGWSS